MEKIIVKHTSVIINNYEMGDCIRLENNFTVYDKTTHNFYYKGILYIKEEKKLILPRGIDIAYLENLFGCKAYIDKHYDPYDIIDETRIKYLPRDEVQQEALEFMSGSSLRYKTNIGKSQLSLNLNTGKGKTYCSVVNSCILRMRSAIITSSIDWLKQWRDCIIEYTDVKPREIYMISGTPTIHRLLTKDISQYKFILISHGTIKSYGDTYGWDKVSELFKYMKIGIKYYDEAHLQFDNICRIDYNTNTYKTYYITATPVRSNKDENKIFQLYFKNIPAIDLFDSEEDPHTRYVAIKYNSRPTPMDISKCKNQYGLDRNKYVGSYIIHNENYYKMVRIILNILLSKKGKSLVYIGTNNAILTTYNWIIEHYPDLEPLIGIYTSIIPDEEKEIRLEKKIILSTTKSSGTAMDIKDLECTVVLAEPFKSEVLARQTLGRTRNPNTLYIEVVDVGFTQINKYYQQKKRVFDKYATSKSEIFLKQNELDTRANAFKRRTLNTVSQIYGMYRRPFVRSEYKSPFIRY